MKEHLIAPGGKVRLADIDPSNTSLFAGGKEEAKKATSDLNKRLEELQELLYAEHSQKVLIVLQGMDTSGKDGTIRNVFDGVDPSGVRVASFKRPTDEELDRDFLWRVHKHVPGRGEMVIFNRSHYEDVLVVRVHSLIGEEIWSKRYDQINAFEKMLAESGTTILKFFLHIDRDEQKKRLESRLEDSTKHWKFNSGDLKERALWDEYQAAYEDALAKTSTSWAPWYVVPANAKWYRNWVISSILVETLERFDMKFPPAEKDLASIVVE